MAIRNNKFPSGEPLGFVGTMNIRSLVFRVEMRVNDTDPNYEFVTGSYIQTSGALPYEMESLSFYLIADPDHLAYLPSGGDSLVFINSMATGPVTALLTYSYQDDPESDPVDVVDDPVTIPAAGTRSAAVVLPTGDYSAFSITLRVPDAP